MNPAPPSARLDPRTVPRSLLLDRLGVTRPDLSVIILSSGEDDPRFDQTDVSCQVIKAVQTEAAIDSAAGQTIRILTDETEIDFINRAAALAIGRVLVFFAGGTPMADDLLESIAPRFRQDIFLGVWIRSPIYAVRADLWNALGGLENRFSSTAWAMADFCGRARAIGFAAPTAFGRHPRAELGAATGTSDARLYRQRRRSAPARQFVKSMNERPIVAYTAITNGYDSLKQQPDSATRDADFVAFVDRATKAELEGRSRGWRLIEAEPAVSDPHRASRFFKANSHLAFPGAAYSLWIDASVSVVSPLSLSHLADIFLGDADICVFDHHARGSVEAEALACIALELDGGDIIAAQMSRYRREGFPDADGLAELPVILRRHTPAIKAFNDAWWAEILAGSRRDQLSFNYVAWKLGVAYAKFPMSIVTPNGLFVKYRRQSEAAGTPSR